MARFPTSAALSDLPTFSEDEVLQGTPFCTEDHDCPGRIQVTVDGRTESLRFYGLEIAGSASAAPLIYLEGDCSRRVGDRWAVFDGYTSQSPFRLQVWAEQIAISINRTFLNLARPGVCGSSGNHQERRRPREVDIIDAALTELKQDFGWDRIDLAGLSGGGHLVAALMARRSDIGCAVIASGNVSVRRRNEEQGHTVDITGYADFVDPIDLVKDVAKHPPECVIVLTDPLDEVVSGSCQTAYVEALRAAGLTVEHRLLPATDPAHHILRDAAVLATAAHSGLGAIGGMDCLISHSGDWFHLAVIASEA